MKGWAIALIVWGWLVTGVLSFVSGRAFFYWRGFWNGFERGRSLSASALKRAESGLAGDLDAGRTKREPLDSTCRKGHGSDGSDKVQPNGKILLDGTPESRAACENRLVLERLERMNRWSGERKKPGWEFGEKFPEYGE